MAESASSSTSAFSVIRVQNRTIGDSIHLRHRVPLSLPALQTPRQSTQHLKLCDQLPPYPASLQPCAQFFAGRTPRLSELWLPRRGPHTYFLFRSSSL